MTSPLTGRQLDDIARSVAAHFNHDEKPETRAARWQSAALAAGREVDVNAFAAYLAVADAEQRALADSWARAMAATDEKIRRLTARQLTEGEYDAAWHAVEGAAGEEGADPGTILHAVLNRLGITVPGAEHPAVEEQPACGKCKQPFDPTDRRFDGHAQHGVRPYCRGCVDACHDNEIADHRCVICA